MVYNYTGRNGNSRRPDNVSLVLSPSDFFTLLGPRVYPRRNHNALSRERQRHSKHENIRIVSARPGYGNRDLDPVHVRWHGQRIRNDLPGSPLAALGSAFISLLVFGRDIHTTRHCSVFTGYWGCCPSRINGD